MKRIALILLLSLAPQLGRAAEFVVQPGGKNQVVFTSKAAMESFEGKTNRLAGTIVTDPASLGDSARVHFEVDLASLDTGIAKRNQHMRENHLETARYPKAIFDGVAVLGPKGASLASGKEIPLDIEGTFTLHGVSRRLRLTVMTKYEAGGGGRIEFRTTFPVGLADYQISRPQFLFLKLADVQKVQVKGVARAAH